MNELFGGEACLDSRHAGNDDMRGHRAELAERLRNCLSETVQQLVSRTSIVRHPDRPIGSLPHGSGHFHLAAELFIQLSGWTVFQFPHGDLCLEAGEILLIPPRLSHSERVGPGRDGRRFENLVVYAEDGAFRCHLAQELSTGVPGILYLDMGRHAQAARIQEWLSGAARVVPESPVRMPSPDARWRVWADIQSSALVTAALAGVLSALDDQQDDAPPEPMPVSRVRVMVQNQLGDNTLTVRRLAEQSGYSADYLSNLFSVATGQRLSTYINRLRVERAAHLLRENTLSGKEIAWACGFSSPSYFIRAFHAHFGQTPKAWRHTNP